MSQEPLSDDVDLNAFGQRLAAARPRASADERDQLLYAAAYGAGQAAGARRVRRWQASAALLAVVALGLGTRTDWTAPEAPRVAVDHPAEAPPLVRAPFVVEQPPREILSAGTRGLALLVEAGPGRARIEDRRSPAPGSTIDPSTASIWSVRSAARLAELEHSL